VARAAMLVTNPGFDRRWYARKPPPLLDGGLLLTGRQTFSETWLIFTNHPSIDADCSATTYIRSTPQRPRVDADWWIVYEERGLNTYLASRDIWEGCSVGSFAT